jgi:hypothetical protein
MANAKAVIKICGMSPQMQQDACAAAAEGIQMFYEENEIAGYVKSEFEKKVRVGSWWRRHVGLIDQYCTQHTHNSLSFYHSHTRTLSLSLSLSPLSLSLSIYLLHTQQYKGLWHCFVGRNFGAFVTHEQDKFSYFYIGQIGFLLFSTV